MGELAETSKHRWGNLPATYDEHNLKIAHYHVMADWERPYMERLAAIAASKGGTVLEVGYGMGISASALQAHNIDSHIVIECHPDVIAQCVVTHRSALTSGSMHLMTGYWQDVTPRLAGASPSADPIPPGCRRPTAATAAVCQAAARSLRIDGSTHVRGRPLRGVRRRTRGGARRTAIRTRCSCCEPAPDRRQAVEHDARRGGDPGRIG